MANDKIIPKNEQFDNVKKFITSPKAMEAIAMALPKHMTPEKMARVVITAITRTPKLLDCTPQSIMQAVIEASQLGLVPDGVLGHGYILPYKTTAVFIPGYKGLLDLARRSGDISWVQARIVFENDKFSYTYGAEPTIHHIPARAEGKEPGKFKAAYGVAKFTSGEVYFEVMHEDEIEDIRRRSRSANAGPWVTDYNEMARKTVIRRLCKFLPMNPEYQTLVARDEYAEAGVLGQYIDIDPATGEVIEQPKAPSSTDMLNMFTDALEGEGEGDEIQDPRFETSEPEPEPETPSPAKKKGGKVSPKEPEEPEEPVDEEPEPPEGEPGSEEAEAAGDPEPESLLEQGQGRISKAEDSAFLAAVEELKKRMLKYQDQDLVDRVINNRLKLVGARDVLEIRTRLDREKFYRECFQMCEQWASLPQPNRE